MRIGDLSKYVKALYAVKSDNVVNIVKKAEYLLLGIEARFNTIQFHKKKLESKKAKLIAELKENLTPEICPHSIMTTKIIENGWTKIKTCIICGHEIKKCTHHTTYRKDESTEEWYCKHCDELISHSD